MAEREPSSGLIANLSEQRMADQMSILDKFYNHYDSQQWHAVIELEGQVRRYTDLDCNPMMKAFCREPILWRTHSI